MPNANKPKPKMERPREDDDEAFDDVTPWHKAREANPNDAPPEPNKV